MWLLVSDPFALESVLDAHDLVPIHIGVGRYVSFICISELNIFMCLDSGSIIGT